MATPRPVKGLLLMNVGTPDDPSPGSVRRFLREFLSDDRMLDIPAVLRWLLLHLIILPVRPRRSAESYRKIWTERGSPLMFHSRDLEQAVRTALAGEYAVELGMRYGNPSLESALEKLWSRGVEELTVLPLYPQNAASSTSSSLSRVYELVRRKWDVLPLKVVGPFFDHPGFLDAFAEVARPAIERARAEKVLFSFHGVPERHVRKSDRTGRHCLESASCCDALTQVNRGCYRAEAFYIARELARRLELPQDRYQVSFQSRLGRTVWVRPYTDHLIPELAQQGVKRLAVVCPAFVADCLETVEEIGIRAKESFVAAGGEELVLVPSLNATPRWVQAVGELVRSGG